MQVVELKTGDRVFVKRTGRYGVITARRRSGLVGPWQCMVEIGEESVIVADDELLAARPVHAPLSPQQEEAMCRITPFRELLQRQRRAAAHAEQVRRQLAGTGGDDAA